MIIGIPKEIKNLENRVAITPSGVDTLVNSGHTVLIENNAGLNSGFTNEIYKEVGAQIIDSAKDIWNKSDMIVKVKEPLKEEYQYFREGLVIFTYLHLASNESLTKALLDNKVTAIAYETIQLDDRSLPLLTPMSEIAGKIAVQHGAVYLESVHGGKGILIDGTPGVPPAHVVVIGAGVVGTAAIKRAIGLGARVTALDVNINQLRYLDQVFYGRIETLYSNDYNIRNVLKSADLVIAAVLIPGAKAPHIIKEDMVKEMSPGSVLIDVAIDQGGCTETITEPTTHENPTFVKHGVLHSAIANIPSSVGQTATIALTNVTIPYISNIANRGIEEFSKINIPFKKGINTLNGKLVCESVASSLNMEYENIDNLIR